MNRQSLSMPSLSEVLGAPFLKVDGLESRLVLSNDKSVSTDVETSNALLSDTL